MNEEFWHQLEKIQKKRPDLIPLELEVAEVYNIRRSLRRGSVTKAREEGVSASVVDTVNRWRTQENRRSGRSGGSMRDYYTEIRLMRKFLLTYSQAL